MKELKFQKPMEEPKRRKEERKKGEIKIPEFEIEEFEEARANFERLIKELTPAIKRHEYDLIIGDDVSGRLPTLVIGGLFKKIYKKDKISPPQILFLSGSGINTFKEKGELETKATAISQYLRDLIDKKKIKLSKNKALLTTESMLGGITANYLSRGIKGAGLSCDIATLSNYSSIEGMKEEEKDLKEVNIYSGGQMRGAHFWSEKELTGVEKHERWIFSRCKEGESRQGLLSAREDAKKMVDYLKKIYDKEVSEA